MHFIKADPQRSHRDSQVRHLLMFFANQPHCLTVKELDQRLKEYVGCLIFWTLSKTGTFGFIKLNLSRCCWSNWEWQTSTRRGSRASQLCGTSRHLSSAPTCRDGAVECGGIPCGEREGAWPRAEESESQMLGMGGGGGRKWTVCDASSSWCGLRGADDVVPSLHGKHVPMKRFR